MKPESIWAQISREQPMLARAISAAHRDGLDAIDMATVGQNSRRYVWGLLQTHLPQFAALLTDPAFLELKAAFGARVEIESRVICRAIAMERRVSRVTGAAA